MLNQSVSKIFKTIPCFLHKNIPLFVTALILTFFVRINNLHSHEIREHQTTRLKATAGTGVGSFLMDESTILNPASLGFFNMSSLYYQRNKADLDFNQESPTSTSEYKDTAIIASDAQNKTGGSFSYINQKFGDQQRKSIGVSMSRPFREDSSFGLTYRRISDTRLVSTDSSEVEKERYNEFSLGVLHSLNDHFSLGVVVDDPFQSRDDSTKATLGFQFLFHDYIVLMFDAGADYTKDIGDTSDYRGAIQVMFYNDFFLRAGYFKDNNQDESGNGIGLGWVGPKLMVEFAIQNIEVDSNTQNQLSSYDIKETSFSLAYKF